MTVNNTKPNPAWFKENEKKAGDLKFAWDNRMEIFGHDPSVRELGRACGIYDSYVRNWMTRHGLRKSANRTTLPPTPPSPPEPTCSQPGIMAGLDSAKTKNRCKQGCHHTSFGIPQEDHFKLVKISINTNRSIGEVVRDAVCEYLKTADVQITEFEKRLMQIKGLNFD